MELYRYGERERNTARGLPSPSTRESPLKTLPKLFIPSFMRTHEVTHNCLFVIREKSILSLPSYTIHARENIIVLSAESCEFTVMETPSLNTEQSIHQRLQRRSRVKLWWIGLLRCIILRGFDRYSLTRSRRLIFMDHRENHANGYFLLYAIVIR